MSKQSSDEAPEPFLQRLYDQPFVLLALCMVVMAGFYTLWGLYEILSLPQSTLP